MRASNLNSPANDHQMPAGLIKCYTQTNPVFAKVAFRDLHPPALCVCRLTLVILNLRRGEKDSDVTKYPPKKNSHLCQHQQSFVNYLHRTQSKCCCQGRNIQRTQFQVSSGSQHRTVLQCTHLCLRLRNHPLVSRLSWRNMSSRNRLMSFLKQ